MKPVIGIPSYIMSRERYIELPFEASVTQQNIVNALINAGALPVVIPISLENNMKDYVDNVDAILLQGGADVNPLLYDEEPSLLIRNIDPNRDTFETAIIKEAWKQKKPIFGICRGMQILNTTMGGSLYQDLSYFDCLKIRHSQTTPMHYHTHSVTLDEDSVLGRVLGQHSKINSLHHQAVKDVADVFRPTAWSKDGVIEGIESKDKAQKVMAVQWHPEDLLASDSYSQEIFNEFVKIIKA